MTNRTITKLTDEEKAARNIEMLEWHERADIEVEQSKAELIKEADTKGANQ